MGGTGTLPSASSRTSRLEKWVPLGVALLTAVLTYQRMPRGSRSTLWAEDGSLFLGDALHGGYDVFAVYAGYLHVVPRIAALLVVHMLDVRSFGLGINVAACALTGVTAAVVYVCAQDVIPGRALRGWLALMTVMLPLIGVEVLANLANLHTMMLWAVFWALVYHPRTLGGAAALAGFTLLACLSEVQTALLAPLALLALLYWRDLRPGLVVAGYALGVAGQTWAVMNHPTGRNPHLLTPSILTQLFGLEVAMPFWILDPQRFTGLIQDYGWWLAAAAALPVTVGLVLALRHGDMVQRVVALVAFGTGLLLFCVSHMMNDAVPGGPGYSVLDSAPKLIRYAVAPSLLLLALLAIGTAAAHQRSLRLPTWLGASCMGGLLVAAVVHFRTPWNYRDRGNTWTGQMAEARAYCRRPDAIEHYFRLSPHPWSVNVPCSLLR